MDLETAYNRFKKRVLSWARYAGVPEADAEDVAHDVFWAFASVVPPVVDAAVSTWLFITTRHVAQQLVRKRTARREVAEDAERAAPHPSQEHAIGTLQVETLLLGFVACLEPKRREVFTRHVLGEEPMDQIAASQGVPLATAHKRLRLARLDLRDAIKRARAEELRRSRRSGTSFALIPFWGIFTRRRFWAVAAPVLGAAGVLAALVIGDGPELAPLDVGAPGERDDIEPFRPAFVFTEAPREAGGYETHLRAGGGTPRDDNPAKVQELPEVDLVSLARHALAEGSPGRARSFLARADRAYPRGSLRPERAALRARATP